MASSLVLLLQCSGSTPSAASAPLLSCLQNRRRHRLVALLEATTATGRLRAPPPKGLSSLEAYAAGRRCDAAAEGHSSSSRRRRLLFSAELESERSIR